jgi:hypothetical protein
VKSTRLLSRLHESVAVEHRPGGGIRGVSSPSNTAPVRGQFAVFRRRRSSRFRRRHVLPSRFRRRRMNSRRSSPSRVCRRVFVAVFSSPSRFRRRRVFAVAFSSPSRFCRRVFVAVFSSPSNEFAARATLSRRMNSRLYRRSLPAQTKAGGDEAPQKGCGKVAPLLFFPGGAGAGDRNRR